MRCATVEQMQSGTAPGGLRDGARMTEHGAHAHEHEDHVHEHGDHAHEHGDHARGHGAPMAEPLYGPTGAGTVMLDVGPGVGALVLSTPPDLNGREIEISRADAPGARRTHSQVRERRAGGRVGYAAVYPGLASGSYTIWRDEATAIGTVEVAGGTVTSFDWS